MTPKCKSIEEYRELVRRLNGLLDDPQPGLSSWCLMFGDVMNSLTALWNGYRYEEGDLTGVPPSARLERALNFYREIPDGQYDLEVVVPLIEAELVRRNHEPVSQRMSGF